MAPVNRNYQNERIHIMKTFETTIVAKRRQEGGNATPPWVTADDVRALRSMIARTDMKEDDDEDKEEEGLLHGAHLHPCVSFCSVFSIIGATLLACALPSTLLCQHRHLARRRIMAHRLTLTQRQHEKQPVRIPPQQTKTSNQMSRRRFHDAPSPVAGRRRGRSPESASRFSDLRDGPSATKRYKPNALHAPNPSLSFTSGRSASAQPAESQLNVETAPPVVKRFAHNRLATFHFGQDDDMSGNYTTDEKIKLLPFKIQMADAWQVHFISSKDATLAEGRSLHLQKELKVLEIQKKIEDEAAARARDDTW
jgi:hypothetical protein